MINVDALIQDPIPSDIKGLRSMLTSIDNIEVEPTRDQSRALAAKRRALADAIRILENGTPAPTITANEHAAIEIGSRTRHIAHSTRLSALESVKAAIAGENADLPSMPAPDERFSPSQLLALEPRYRLLLDPSIRKLLNSARAASLDFEVYFIQNEARLFPQQAAVELKARMAYEPDLAVAQSLCDQLTTISAPGALEFATRLKSVALDHLSAARSAQVALMEAALARLTDYESEAKDMERGFFAAFGLDREATRLSKRYAEMIATVQAAKARLTDPSVLPALTRDAAVSGLAWIGIRDLAA